MSDLNPFPFNQSDQNAAIQSFLQQQGGRNQAAQATAFQDGSSVMPSGAGGISCWQQCRVCQQSFFTTVECLQEHEISCQLNLQVQNFLQQQQQQQQQDQMAQLQAQAWQQVAAQNEFQKQLQIQQNQLQRQMNQQQQQQQNQFDLLDLAPMFGNDFGRSVAPPMNSSINDIFQSNDFESQSHPQGQVADAQAHHHNQNQVNYILPKPPTPSSPNHFMLALPSDDMWLTPLHCFVRRYCVEAFIATSKDIAAPCMGKRNPLSVDQVGIRCPYCSPDRIGKTTNTGTDDSPACENGVVYPSIISRIYNSSINLLQRHLRLCPHVPPAILARYEELKSSNARSGASKKYWVDSAITLGLMDTPHGIRLDRKVHSAQKLNAEVVSGTNGSNSASKDGVDNTWKKNIQAAAPSLVLPSDKRSTTAFTFHLLSQMQPCVFSEADRLGRRRGLKVGFTGLACRHCFGIHGSGRFFPSSVKTMADASKSLDVIYRHVMKCKNCPWEVKGTLRSLREVHDSERNNMPFGNQRAFFVKVWHRLHANSEVPPSPLSPHDIMATKPVIELNQFVTNAA